jgi:hypothetical protein
MATIGRRCIDRQALAVTASIHKSPQSPIRWRACSVCMPSRMGGRASLIVIRSHVLLDLATWKQWAHLRPPLSRTDRS